MFQVVATRDRVSTMMTLREKLQQLKKPVEVDAIRSVVEEAEQAVADELETHKERIADIIVELERCRGDLHAVMENAEEVDDGTGEDKGLMATMRATFAADKVEEIRERAASNLIGVSGVLTRRLQRAFLLVEDAQTLRNDVQFAADALLDLEVRARVAELRDEARFIQQSKQRLEALAPRLGDLSTPLATPVRGALDILEEAKRQTAELQSSERASTFGESTLDGVLPDSGGAVTQFLRKAVGDRAPSLVSKRNTVGYQEALDELGDSLEGSAESALKEEALRRAAEAELDALD